MDRCRQAVKLRFGEGRVVFPSPPGLSAKLACGDYVHGWEGYTGSKCAAGKGMKPLT